MNLIYSTIICIFGICTLASNSMTLEPYDSVVERFALLLLQVASGLQSCLRCNLLPVCLFQQQLVSNLQ